MRDFQRQRLYDAEGVLRQIYDWSVEAGNPAVTIAGVPLVLPPESRFGSVDSMQAYCDRVCALLDVRPVTVRARRGDAKAHYEGWGAVIAVPDHGDRWAMRELVLLHELSHHIAPLGDRHGPRFVSTFIDVLGVVMGAQAGLAMRLVCADAGVKEGACA